MLGETEAKKQLDLALALNPKGAVGYFWRAKVLSRQGLRQQSIADLQTATEIKPDYLEAYLELEQIYKQAGELQRAAEVSAAYKRIKQSPAEPGTNEPLRFLPDVIYY